VVADDWHARFDARKRHYVFRIISRRAPLTFEKGQMWRVNRPLDAGAMQKGADYLIGLHDFTTFRSTLCQAKSPVKTLNELRIEQINHANGIEYRFPVLARSFRHNQVRSFVGSLERVGSGAWAPEDVKTALEARNRAACGPVSPPDGLYLAGVTYPSNPFGT
jgi:tRNA pseudouridine38-40 synthase